MASKGLHALNYLMLGAVVLFLVWLWHDTKVHDEAALQAVATAKADQAISDKQGQDQLQASNEALKSKNDTLQKQLQVAKSAAQQAQLINKLEGTHLTVAAPQVDPQPTNPSQVTLPTKDLLVLAKDATECAEAKNQVAADKLQNSVAGAEIQSRDVRIKADEDEITALKGGSHWKQFLKAAKYIAIGAAVGVTEESIRRH